MTADYEAFAKVLTLFDVDDVQGGTTAVIHEAIEMVAEAVVIGSAFGPGAPLDTGFLRSAFTVGIGAPRDGASTPPKRARSASRVMYRQMLNLSRIMQSKLGDAVYFTTSVFYAEYLETLPLRRRNGPSENRGSSTKFVQPVVEKWVQIVDDAARRKQFGVARG